jgi:hypothetical protein
MTGPEIGLCVECRHARVQRSARGSEFWRCLRAGTDAAYPRYPALPVRECAGFERAAGNGEPRAGAPRRS